MKCPHCGELTDADAVFCEFCGKEIEGTRSAPQETAPQAENASRPVGDWDLQADARAMVEATKKRASAFSEEMDPGGRGCRWLTVEYAANRFLMAGAQMPLELRVCIDHQNVKRVQIWYSASVGGKAETHSVDAEELVFGRAVPLVVPYYLSDASIGGMLNAKFYFGCVLEDRVEFYQMDVRHTIYTKEQSAQSIIANISANGGSVVDMGNLRALATSACSNGDTLIARANSEPPQFKEVALRETTWRPERLFTKEDRTYACDSLTLEIDGHRYQLCGKKCVKLGRKSDLNDLIVAECGGKESDREWPNNTISRTHAQIHWCGDSVTVFDTSSFGTFINGSKPETGGNAGIPLPGEADIRMGDINLKMEMQRCEQRPTDPVCANCTAGRIKSLSLKMPPGSHQTLLMVWQCCELGYLDKALAGYTVFRRNGGFMLRLPDGTAQCLVPGREVRCRQLVVKVKRLSQGSDAAEP